MTITAPERMEHRPAATGWTKGKADGIRPATPPLQAGDHLSRAEFERRYGAMQHVKRAELIEGVVYMPSPVYIQHGEPHANIMGWLFVYKLATPGLRLADNPSVRMDFDNEVQPDAVLFRDPRYGGRCQIGAEGFIEGSPELVIEVSGSTVSFDMNTKLRVYRRNGVQEYLVLLAQEERAVWHALVEGEYQALTSDEQGIVRSQVFPGLWLHPERFWAGDLDGLMAVLEQGLASQEHADFVGGMTAASQM